MKKAILLLPSIIAFFIVKAQNVGIGTPTPAARLHVTDSSVLFSAALDIPGSAGSPAMQGPGRRMFWYADKAAFRVGYANGTQWDLNNMGPYSFAVGHSTTASGYISLATGLLSIASGDVSTALGSQTIASGNYSTSMGESTMARSAYETVIGRWNTEYFPVSTTLWDSGDRLFTVGNGTSAASRSDAMTIVKNGYIGIGNSSPGFPLTFNDALGDKISLWTDGTPTHYGFGVQSNLLQIFAKSLTDDIAFGYGNSTSLTETMRIKGNGKVGIGNNNPAYQLDLSNRMRIRSGGSNSVSAGLWLNNNANSEAAFVGMEDDTHVGFYGIVSGFKFTMNTQTGALKINGSEGTSGQVLQSNGNGASAGWVNSTNALYNNTTITANFTGISVSAGNPPILIPGLSKTITVNANAKILIHFNIPIATVNCFGCGTSIAQLSLYNNNVLVGAHHWELLNTIYFSITGTHYLSVPAGTHTLELRASVTGPNVNFGCCLSGIPPNMITQVITQ